MSWLKGANRITVQDHIDALAAYAPELNITIDDARRNPGNVGAHLAGEVAMALTRKAGETAPTGAADRAFDFFGVPKAGVAEEVPVGEVPVAPVPKKPVAKKPAKKAPAKPVAVKK